VRIVAAWTAARTALAAVAFAVLLSGCASTIADLPVIGVPEGTPERPAVQPPYPAVHDMPPRRTDLPLTSEEQQQLEKELIEARDGQSKAAEAIAQPEPARKREPPAKKKAGAPRAEATGGVRNP
jgi:hypothetical protein